ncbi:MAG: hypothetical protein ACRENA_07185, partial [Vulcanimicrobiaceae bacterium]
RIQRRFHYRKPCRAWSARVERARARGQRVFRALRRNDKTVENGQTETARVSETRRLCAYGCRRGARVERDANLSQPE